MLKDTHWRIGSQHGHIEHAGIFDKVVRVVTLVDRHGNLQGVARDLNHRVHDATVVDIVVIGGQDIKAVTYVE